MYDLISAPLSGRGKILAGASNRIWEKFFWTTLMYLYTHKYVNVSLHFSTNIQIFS